MGTWQGTFTSQASSSAKCLAAKQTGLVVTVEKATLAQDGDAIIEGKLSGVAHLHPDLDKNADSTEGDETLENVPFAGRISTGGVTQDVIGLLAGNNPKKDVAGIVFECTTQEMSQGKVSLTLTFGTSSKPDAASATLVSTHSYQDTFLLLLPYQRDARFADTFTLEKID